MTLTAETQTNIVDLCKQGKFTNAADLLVGETKEEHSYEEVLESLTHLGTNATPGVITSLYNAYNDSATNVPLLSEKLHNIISNHSINKIIASAPTSEEKRENQVKDSELESAISNLRLKQQEHIKKNGTPDKDIADKLAALISRQQTISGHASAAKFEKKNIELDNPEAKGAKNWFVPFDASDSEKNESIKVVTGSPIIGALRDRYEAQYKIRIDDSQIAKRKNMSPEAQFELNKEIDREKAFVETYKDPSSIEDRDIFVHQVDSKFITDQYQTIKPQSASQDHNVKEYLFPNGKLIDKYDNDTKKHYLEVEGQISGTFIVCTKKRTESGRIIDDAYDIVEFRDGVPTFYTSSSKGNVSLRNAEDIKRSTSQTRVSLERPSPASLNPITTEKSKEILTQQAPIDKPQAIEDPLISPPQNLPQEPLKATLEEAPQKSPETLTSEMQEAPAPQPQTPTTEQEQSAGFFRSQLLVALTKETSATTINYLALQVAKEENKSLEDIKKEFKIQTQEQKTAETTTQIANTAVNTPTEKSLDNKIKDKENVAPNIAKTPELEAIKEALIRSFKSTNTESQSIKPQQQGQSR